MINVWTIAKREYRLYFSSPVAYMLAFFLFLVLGFFFSYSIQIAASAMGMQQGYVPGVDITLQPMAVMLVLLTPALTTRLLAEERRLGTIELLMTAPVRDWELVVGKWLGAFMLLLTYLAVSLIYPMILNQLISPGVDQGPLLTGYLGLILLSAATVAVGVFVSSLFSNQIAAFAATMGVVIFLWWIISVIGQVAGQTGGATELARYLDYSGHFYDNLLRGVVDLRDVTYYLSVTALSLFLSAMSIEVRRWG
ncbi:MAG: ABC transporter permease [Anaerolineales bacterium]|jgi:ABC-2 type transport system permease protein|nr:ABC transporter permease [Anaerolineales bacterium]